MDGGYGYRFAHPAPPQYPPGPQPGQPGTLSDATRAQLDQQREQERHRVIAQHLSQQIGSGSGGSVPRMAGSTPTGHPSAHAVLHAQQAPPLPYMPPPMSGASPCAGGDRWDASSGQWVGVNGGLARSASPRQQRVTATPRSRQASGLAEGSGDDTGAAGTPSGASGRGRGVVRTFSVLLTDRYGNRWYERDVTCSRASDLTAILERRLGMPLRELLYQGRPLEDASFPFVPDELKLECRTGPDSPSPRRQLTLYVEDTPRRVTCEAGSVAELCQRLRSMGISADQLTYKVRTPAGEDLWEPLQTLDCLSYEHHVRWNGSLNPPLANSVQQDGGGYGGGPLQSPPSPDGPQAPPRPPPPSRPPPDPNRHLSPAAAFTPQTTATTAAGIDVQRLMVEAGRLLMAALPVADDDEVAAATARVTQQFKEAHPTTVGGREPTASELAYLRSLVDQHLSSVGGAVGAGPSVFKSVTFGIAGAFPLLDGSEDPDSLQLVPPSVTVSGQPVVILAHAQDTMIDIRCTLGYVNEEERVVVVNLDEFYVNGWVTIGKTSSASLFLSFQPDVLRAGVHYHVDLTAFPADQPGVRIGAAQCEFTIYDSLDEQRRQEPPPPAAPFPMMQPVGGGGGMAPFDAQLRDFVETKVLPLYQLSSNPRVTKQRFDAIVDRACADFWDLAPDTVLGEEHKRAILARVKEGIVSASE